MSAVAGAASMTDESESTAGTDGHAPLPATPAGPLTGRPGDSDWVRPTRRNAVTLALRPPAQGYTGYDTGATRDGSWPDVWQAWAVTRLAEVTFVRGLDQPGVSASGRLRG